MQLAFEQKILGPRSLLVCTVVIQFSIILSIDMYVPALSSLQQEFGVSASYLNLTMFAYFVVAAIGVVVTGPASDRLGRKPLLVAGSALFALSSLGCAASPTVAALVVFRMGEALGFGMVSTVETAVVKDSYSGDSLRTAMTCVQSLIVIGPAAAPFLGTGILSLSGWRMIFMLLAAVGVVVFVLSLLLTETRPKSVRTSSGSFSQAMVGMFGDMGGLLRDKSFAALTLVLGVMAIPYFAFIAIASYVFFDWFEISYLDYSLLYALICIVSIIAPFVYSAMAKRMHGSRILMVTYALTLTASALLAFLGYKSAFLFLFSLIPYALAEGIARPMAFMVLLDQPKHLVGAASSCANFSYNIIPAFATVLATLPWPDYIFGQIVLTFATFALLVILYLWGLRGKNLDGNESQ